MIIVSQDGKEVINFEAIAEVVVQSNTVVVTDNFMKHYGLIIGTYKNEERAREVLNGIVDFFSRADYDNAPPVNFEQALIIVLARQNGAFIMPKE